MAVVVGGEWRCPEKHGIKKDGEEMGRVISGLIGDGVKMGWNQRENFDNAKSIWAQGSRWRQHRFVLYVGYGRHPHVGN